MYDIPLSREFALEVPVLSQVLFIYVELDSFSIDVGDLTFEADHLTLIYSDIGPYGITLFFIHEPSVSFAHWLGRRNLNLFVLLGAPIVSIKAAMRPTTRNGINCTMVASFVSFECNLLRYRNCLSLYGMTLFAIPYSES